jgi:hypothetical protein
MRTDADTRPELAALALEDWEPSLAFLESAYQAGATLAGWDRTVLQSTWCPAPPELSDLLAPVGSRQ